MTEETLDENIEIVEEPKQETKRDSFKTSKSDPGFLVAKGNFSGSSKKDRTQAQGLHIHKLSKAIVRAMENHGYAKVRSVGDAAMTNAIKAVQRAGEICLTDRDIRLYWEVSKQTGNIGELRGTGHVSNVGAMLFSLAKFEKE